MGILVVVQQLQADKEHWPQPKGKIEHASHGPGTHLNLSLPSSGSENKEYKRLLLEGKHTLQPEKRMSVDPLQKSGPYYFS